MLRVRRSLFIFSPAPAAFLIFPVSLFAQWIEPSGGDPATVACPNGPTNGPGIDAQQAWVKGRQFALIEGDGVFGIGNWGHVPESLAWYCKASAAGNPVAAYDIAEIFREGYAVNSRGPGGQIITKHFLPDLPTAFYWYQLAANQGYTRAMLAVAQYCALGDQTLKGSHVRRNFDQAWTWLNKAADKGDTVAIEMLWFFLTGRKPAPWGMALSRPMDKAATARVGELSLNLASIIGEKISKCTKPENFEVMKHRLPDASEGRRVRGVSFLAARGSIEVDCILSLSGPPPSQQDEPLLDQFERLIHGRAVNSWEYSIFTIPGHDDDLIQRQTATEAMIQGVEEMAVILQTLSPPLRTQDLTPGRQRVDLTGTWEMRVEGDSPNDVDISTLGVMQDREVVIISMLGALGPKEIFRGKFASPNSVVGTLTTSISKSEETITIDGPNHATLVGIGEMTRVSAQRQQLPDRPYTSPSANTEQQHSASVPAAPKLPTVMHFCAQHCLTFTLENGQFTNYTNLLGQWNERRVFAVERFTRESVIIHRTDTGSNPLTALYTGRMSDDGNSVSGNGWKMTWGAALNTLPGSDEERDGRR